MLDFCIEFDYHVLNVMVVLTFICAVLGGLYLLLSNKPDAIARFNCVKEVMIMFLGLVGAIIGFYMGR